MRNRWAQVAVALLVVLVLSGVASACPMCKDSISDTAAAPVGGMGGGPQAGLPGGFNVSVYVMLFSAFGVMGFVAHVIIKGVRETNIGAARGFPVGTKAGPSADATDRQPARPAR
jgi:hypothetical protein